MERNLTKPESRLVRELLQRSGVNMESDWLEKVKVIPMRDGGMGSLRFNSADSDRKMSSQAAEIHFKDADGVDVIASLNLDHEGSPIELDIWKVNFMELIRIPDSFE
ncbi:DUF6984 family protein [Dokdonella koreensis]|uniref:DUF6984 family protein n=1 Tax=Dokdonella koreensis TaxID=323415 RepID=UPI003CCDCFE5